ncbi:MAG: LysM peptidoglycan-binding domain-containing protein [Bacteroidales bacterium]|nr:LysM peptidoglycan-binding domain-containing protein [Bacteroidales bacterium]
MIRKQFIFFTLVFFLFPILLWSQEQKSEQIKWIDGQKYYIHIVTKGQGLYTIKRLYGVEEKVILENNPEAFDGLKEGQELKIPYATVVKEPSKYKEHEIKEGETIYAISKIYGVSSEAILELNPEAKNGYKIGQVLKIPNIVETTDEQDEEAGGSDGKTYKVKKKDTLYSLAKQFDVSQEDILRENPIVAQEGLKKGQILNIPGKEIIVKEALYVPVENVSKDSTDEIMYLPCTKDSMERNKPMNVALMLPFSMDEMAYTNEKENRNHEKPIFNTKPFFEFYQALLISLEELKAKGYKINLHVYDTKNSVTTVQEIVSKPVIGDMDLIIGPVYSAQINVVQKVSDSLKIPLINPFIRESEVALNGAYTIDIFPSNRIIMEQSIKLLMMNDTSKLFIVHSGHADDQLLVESFKTMYPKMLSWANKDSNKTYKELIFSDSKKMDFKPFLEKNKNNLMIVLSDNQAFVSNVFTRLNIQTEKNTIQVVGRPEWQKFDNIDVEYFHHLNYLQLVNFYVDYSNVAVNAFLSKYRETYKMEPSKYAFTGYDISNYFIVYFYKNKSLDCFKNLPYKGLSTNFKIKHYKKGWGNISTDVIFFNSEFNVSKRYQIEESIIEVAN